MYLGRWRWIRPRWEVFVTFGHDDERGIPEGGAGFGGFYLSEKAARRSFERQKVRSEKPSPQTVYLFRWHPDWTPKTEVDRKRLA